MDEMCYLPLYILAVLSSKTRFFSKLHIKNRYNNKKKTSVSNIF